MAFRFHENNLAKHGVSIEEVEECFMDPDRLLRAVGGVYVLIAATAAGRVLELAFERDKDGTAYIFHGMNARP
jgi:uncharacterized DUF497 family protein